MAERVLPDDSTAEVKECLSDNPLRIIQIISSMTGIIEVYATCLTGKRRSAKLYFRATTRNIAQYPIAKMTSLSHIALQTIGIATGIKAECTLDMVSSP